MKIIAISEFCSPFIYLKTTWFVWAVKYGKNVIVDADSHSNNNRRGDRIVRTELLAYFEMQPGPFTVRA